MADTKLSQAYDKYGASMGRRSVHDIPAAAPVKFYLRRVPLDCGGYDNGGAYWGTGTTLWNAIGETGDDDVSDFFFRANDREDAKAYVRSKYPAARFYR